MTRISKRSLKASKEGIQLASRAILRFPTKIDFAAELEISRSTVQNFFAGKPVGRENFHKICQELELCWQDVAELPQQRVITTTESKIKLEELVASSPPTEDNSLLAELRQRVRQRIASMCGTMRVLDMSCPMSTEYIYVNVNVYEKIKGRRRLEFDSVCEAFLSNKSQPFDAGETRPDRISGLLAANRYSKLIVFGKPGAGKTMFLKHLTLQCLKGTFESDRIPIYVPFRDFVESDFASDLINCIALQLSKDNRRLEIDLVKKLLNEGKFFLVLDGLDEIKPDQHQHVCKYLRRFTEWFPNNRYLLSCRHGVEYCNFEQFTEVEIADFRPEQISDFAAKWFDTEDKQKSISFLQKLKHSSSIQEFATSPLLLTLLCILFEGADFPASRSEIYEEGLDIMFKQWDAERNIDRETEEGLSPEQEKELLCEIALKAFEKNQYLFKEAELKLHIINYLNSPPNTATKTKINAKEVLKSIEAKHGLLVEQAKKVYSFSHLAFQEYLTARKFIRECDLEVTKEMLHRLVKNMLDERWREIFLLVAEMSPQADLLLEIMTQQIDSQLAEAPKIEQFLDWVNCKAEAVIENSSAYSERPQFQPVTIRAFYFSLGLSQILGDVGSNLNLTLSLNPSFSRTLANNPDLALDLNLLNISNLGRNLDSIQRPCLTFQRILDRAIANAAKIKPELARELRTIKQQLPSLKNSKTEFWLWWHKNGIAWSDKIVSVVMKHRNIGYQWQFAPQQHNLLKQYHQANLLLIDCLSRSCYVSHEHKQAIEDRLLTSTNIDRNESWKMRSILAHSLT